MVNVVAFSSGDPRSNPTEVHFLFGVKINEKEPHFKQKKVVMLLF